MLIKQPKPKLNIYSCRNSKRHVGYAVAFNPENAKMMTEAMGYVRNIKNCRVANFTHWLLTSDNSAIFQAILNGGKEGILYGIKEHGIMNNNVYIAGLYYQHIVARYEMQAAVANH